MKLQNLHPVFLLLAILATMISCETEGLDDLPPLEPEFRLQGTIAGNPFDFAAGLEGYHMYRYGQEDGIYRQYGGILQPVCSQTSCPEGIEIVLYDSSRMTGTTLPEVLLADMLPFVDNFTPPQPIRHRVRFSSGQQLPQPVEYFWLIDGEEYFEASPEVWLSGDEHFICLTTRSGPDACLSQICKTINLGTHQQCEVTLEFSVDNPLDFIVEAEASGPGTYTVEWNQPGGIGQSLVLPQGGQEYICATIIDSSECIALLCAQVSFADSFILDYCMSDFAYEVLETTAQADPYHGKVVVSYTDVDGTRYQSDRIAQTNSFFTIQSAGEYRPDPQSPESYMIDIQLNTDLVDANGNVINLDAGGTFALGKHE